MLSPPGLSRRPAAWRNEAAEKFFPLSAAFPSSAATAAGWLESIRRFNLVQRFSSYCRPPFFAVGFSHLRTAPSHRPLTFCRLSERESWSTSPPSSCPQIVLLDAASERNANVQQDQVATIYCSASKAFR